MFQTGERSKVLLQSINAKERLSNSSRLSFGCSVLDELTGGGLPCFPITEISGEAGSGKTQLLLGLALAAQLPKHAGGLEGGCLYLATEGAVPVERLRTFLTHRPLFKEHLTDEALNSVLIEDRIPDAQALWLTIFEKVPIVLAAGYVKLVIIDSIAAVFRGEFSGRDGMRDRNSWFFGLASMMKRLSDQYGCTFIVANQISHDVVTGKNKPALGLAWSSCVNQRLFLELHGSLNDQNVPGNASSDAQDFSQRRRVLSVSFSPSLPCGVLSSYCVVSKSGFHAL